MTPPSLPDVPQLFARFDSDAGSDAAARVRFQLFVTDLVKVRHPDATTVAGPGGRDWGIDTFAGQLAGGKVRIWQSKYVTDWSGDGPQQQVRESFKSSMKNARVEGYEVTAWTLVVPAVLDPKQMKWFQGWAKREGKANGLSIDIWDGSELRNQLVTRDAADVRREYFPHTVEAVVAMNPVATSGVAVLNDPRQYESALFVRQLREAGRVETDAACAQYFATDALLRDLAARGESTKLAAMDALQLDVHQVWENHFNDLASAATADGHIPDLVRFVDRDVAVCTDPPELKLAPAHRRGTAHRLVEQRRAGWVIHWRDVAEDHHPHRALSDGVNSSGETAEGVGET